MQNNQGSFSYPAFKWFMGVVESIKDPEKLGRVKVRIYGFHSDDNTEVNRDDLPWAMVMQHTGNAAISGIGSSATGLVNGSTVVGFFSDGENSEMPIIIGTLPGKPKKQNDNKKGFQDPDGKYPTYKDDEQDTNRLARGVKKDTIIEKKDKDITGNEPKSPYKAEYPYNHVRETVSGHIEEFDDTPGHERIHRYHKAGTFEEIHPDGSRVMRVVKKNYEIVFDDNSVHVKGDYTLKIEGNYSIDVDGNINIKAGGNCKVKASVIELN